MGSSLVSEINIGCQISRRMRWEKYTGLRVSPDLILDNDGDVTPEEQVEKIMEYFGI